MMRALRAGSIPGTCDFFMMMVERHAAVKASVKRERRRVGVSVANVGASITYSFPLTSQMFATL